MDCKSGNMPNKHRLCLLALPLMQNSTQDNSALILHATIMNGPSLITFNTTLPCIQYNPSGNAIPVLQSSQSTYLAVCGEEEASAFFLHPHTLQNRCCHP